MVDGRVVFFLLFLFPSFSPPLCCRTLFCSCWRVAQVDYAAAAYCGQSQVEPWTCKCCTGDTTGFVITSYFLDEDTDTNAFVGYHQPSKTIILSFEGSQSTMNWITNLNFLRVDTQFPGAPSGVEVHGGFYKAYKSAYDGCLGQESGFSIIARVASYR